jgi:hypothetical protein
MSKLRSGGSYAELEEIAALRASELRPLLEPYIRITDQYGALIGEVVLVLGTTSPQDDQDVAIRDLLADTFDFLYEARHFIIRGKPDIAYPLARRGYESLSLLVACHLDTKLAARWMAGKRVSNEDVRKVLAKHPKGESESATRELCKAFSNISHPNRDAVAYRFLGEGNEFVLGSIGRPSLVLLADYALKTLDLWFWFGAVVVSAYFPTLYRVNPGILKTYDEAVEGAKAVSAWLTTQYNRVLADERAEMAKMAGPDDKRPGQFEAKGLDGRGYAIRF